MSEYNYADSREEERKRESEALSEKIRIEAAEIEKEKADKKEDRKRQEESENSKPSGTGGSGGGGTSSVKRATFAKRLLIVGWGSLAMWLLLVVFGVNLSIGGEPLYVDFMILGFVCLAVVYLFDFIAYIMLVGAFIILAVAANTPQGYSLSAIPLSKWLLAAGLVGGILLLKKLVSPD